jgi:hypothetical protein
MNIRGAKMAAEAKRLIDHPAAKWLLGATQALAVAIIMGLGSSAIDKLNSILTAINAFGKDLALLQQQVNLNTSGLSTNKADVDMLKANVLRLDMRVEQLEREDRKSGH